MTVERNWRSVRLMTIKTKNALRNGVRFNDKGRINERRSMTRISS